MSDCPLCQMAATPVSGSPERQFITYFSMVVGIEMVWQEGDGEKPEEVHPQHRPLVVPEERPWVDHSAEARIEVVAAPGIGLLCYCTEHLPHCPGPGHGYVTSAFRDESIRYSLFMEEILGGVAMGLWGQEHGTWGPVLWDIEGPQIDEYKPHGWHCYARRKA